MGNGLFCRTGPNVPLYVEEEENIFKDNVDLLEEMENLVSVNLL